MGFLDKVVKAAKVVGDFLDDGQLNGSNGSDVTVKNAAASAVKEAVSEAKKKDITSADTLASGNVAAKPDVAFVKEFATPDEGSVEVRLSGDFADVSGYTTDPFFNVWEYAPNGVADPDINDPVFIIEYFYIETAVSDVFENFKNGRAQSADVLSFEKLDDERFMFKAKVKGECDRVYYFHGFKYNDEYDKGILGVYYREDVLGTALEQKLITAADNAAASYREI